MCIRDSGSFQDFRCYYFGLPNLVFVFEKENLKIALLSMNCTNHLPHFKLKTFFNRSNGSENMDTPIVKGYTTVEEKITNPVLPHV